MRFILFCVAFQLMTVDSLFINDVCPVDNKKGTCMPLLNCVPLKEEIMEKGINSVRKKISDITCGFDNDGPLVCCVVPTKDVTVTSRFTAKYYDDGLPNVQDHPNLSLLPEDCGKMYESNKIFGGNATRIFEMPWMVMLNYYNKTSNLTVSNCGGTIISAQYVLTAAHCVKYLGQNIELRSVRVGEHNLETQPDCETLTNKKVICAPESVDVPVADTIAHRNFSLNSLQNDIALLRLSKPLNIDQDSVSAICLPLSHELQKDSLEKVNGTAIGWGLTESGYASPVLLSVDLPTANRTYCQSAYGRFPKITEKHICAGGIKGKDACGGDSGGPIMYPALVEYVVRQVQRGVVSFGTRKCGIGNVPAVFTKVAYYIDWILDNMNE